MKIMLSAGEVSGDIQGARIAEAILAEAPKAQLFGLGGRRMEQAGVRLVRNFADYNVMGVWEVVKNLRRILQLLSELEDSIREEKPDLLVLIDYPDFNWRLAKKAKALGVPVFPPSAWAWRKGRAKDCAAIADEFCAIFPHELPPYEAAGAKISFVGNPMVDAVRPEIPEQEAREYFALAEDEQAVLLLPGSRRQEIELLLPDMLGAVHILAEGQPGLRFFLPVADQALEARITSLIEAALVISGGMDCPVCSDGAGHGCHGDLRHGGDGSGAPESPLRGAVPHGEAQLFPGAAAGAYRVLQPAEYHPGGAF